MPQIELTSAERREYRAAAHHLDPVVLIGGDGLTPGVRKEIDAALNAHGLIKIRVFSDDRAARELMYQELTAELNAAPVQTSASCWCCGAPSPKKNALSMRTACPAPRTSRCSSSASAAASAPRSRRCACWATSA